MLRHVYNNICNTFHLRGTLRAPEGPRASTMRSFFTFRTLTQFRSLVCVKLRPCALAHHDSEWQGGSLVAYTATKKKKKRQTQATCAVCLDQVVRWSRFGVLQVHSPQRVITGHPVLRGFLESTGHDGSRP